MALVCIGVVSAVLTGTLIGLWLTNPGQAMDPTHRAVTRYLLENEIGDPDFEYVKWEEEPFVGYQYGELHMSEKSFDYNERDHYTRLDVTVRVTMLGGKGLRHFYFLVHGDCPTHMAFKYTDGEFYGLSSESTYLSALGSEPDDRATEPIREILASPPSSEFEKLWLADTEL